MEKKKEEIIVVDVNEEVIKGKLYEIRGQRVMLDFELAEIYGYTTKSFNQQVNRNKDRFESDFCFKLSREEWENLRLQNETSSWGGLRYLPRAFTEQGIYMLMTILNGDLAVKQSKALVRTFKKMKDYIIANQNLIGQRELMRLSMQTTENTSEISRIRMDIGSVERQMSDVMDQLGDVVTKSDLSNMMNSFVSDDNGWLMYNSKFCSADVAYASIYSQAKKTVYLIDNYIGLRTLVMLKNTPANTDIILFSDNIGYSKLHKVEYNDFRKEYTKIKMIMKHTNGVCHDRFIVLDYGTDNERVFLCGASSKDAGARITSIVEDFGVEKYKPIIDQLLMNEELELQ
jgi:hypothetical protein